LKAELAAGKLALVVQLPDLLESTVGPDSGAVRVCTNAAQAAMSELASAVPARQIQLALPAAGNGAVAYLDQRPVESKEVPTSKFLLPGIIGLGRIGAGAGEPGDLPDGVLRRHLLPAHRHAALAAGPVRRGDRRHPRPGVSRHGRRHRSPGLRHRARALAAEYVAAQFPPHRCAVLFGSYAKGQQKLYSDLDVLVVLPAGEVTEKRRRAGRGGDNAVPRAHNAKPAQAFQYEGHPGPDPPGRVAIQFDQVRNPARRAGGGGGGPGQW